MADDDNFKQGQGFASQVGGSDAGAGNPKPPNAAPKPAAKKERSRNLDTQSLKALAPSNEVARSALEMRQNLEKFMPPGPQRDQLIAQLKADVTPILGPELDARNAALGAASTQAALTSEQDLNEAIDRAAEAIRNRLGQFETFGPVKEVASVPTATIEHLRSVLHDLRRNRGEFQIAIGLKDNKHFSSSRYFEPSPLETFAYERQTNEGLADLQVSGYVIEALLYSHQNIDGKDASHFSTADIEQADFLQQSNPGIAVHSFLLTPAPENILIIYTPNTKEKMPLGEAVGFFTEDGNFHVRNEKYLQAFADAKLQA